MGVIQSPAADYFFRRIGATDQDRGFARLQNKRVFALFMVIRWLLNRKRHSIVI